MLDGIHRELLDPDPQSSLKMEYLSRALASEVIRHHGRIGRAAEKSKAVATLSVNQFDTINGYLIDRIGETVTLDELARICGMGRTNFVRRFRQTTGKSPHAYIMSIRLRQAKEMLADRSHSLCFIAYACGFCDQAHFTKLFKRIGTLMIGNKALKRSVRHKYLSLDARSRRKPARSERYGRGCSLPCP